MRWASRTQENVGFTLASRSVPAVRSRSSMPSAILSTRPVSSVRSLNQAVRRGVAYVNVRQLVFSKIPHAEGIFVGERGYTDGL
jgi:hypothetical protein